MNDLRFGRRVPLGLALGEKGKIRVSGPDDTPMSMVAEWDEEESGVKCFENCSGGRGPGGGTKESAGASGGPVSRVRMANESFRARGAVATALCHLQISQYLYLYSAYARRTLDVTCTEPLSFCSEHGTANGKGLMKYKYRRRETTKLIYS